MPDVFTSTKSAKVAHSKPINKNHGETFSYPKTKKEIEKLPGHSKNPLAAYNYFPDKVDFVNRDPQEKVILLLRRHPVTNIKWIVIAFILVFTAPFLSVAPIFDSLPPQYLVVFSIFWYLATLAFVFEKFLSWYFGVNIVTDERVFDVDFHNLIYRRITDANISEIQDVTVEIGGALRTTFNFGNVLIQTASEVPEIEFHDVPQPDKVAKVLRELRVEEEVEQLEGRVR